MKVTKTLGVATIGTLDIVISTANAGVNVARMAENASLKALLEQLATMEKDLTEIAEESGISVQELKDIYESRYGQKI